MDISGEKRTMKNIGILLNKLLLIIGSIFGYLVIIVGAAMAILIISSSI